MNLINLSHLGRCSKISTIFSFHKILNFPKLVSVQSIQETVTQKIKNVSAFSPMFITTIKNTLISLRDKHFTKDFTTQFPATLSSGAT